MNKKQLKVLLDYIEDSQRCATTLDREKLRKGVEEVLLATEEDDMIKYSALLQEAIEFHCDGKKVPHAVAKGCPQHAKLLNRHRDKIIKAERRSRERENL